MSTRKRATRPQYRVITALIQLQTPLPGRGGYMETTDRHLRRDDLLPPWVDDDEIAHLLSVPAIEEVK